MKIIKLKQKPKEIYEFNGRKFVALENGVHEVINGKLIKIKPKPLND